MDIAYSSRAPKPEAKGWTYVADPVELAARSDVFFVTLAANAATRHIVNGKVIEAVGPDGMLINISRAANIDERITAPCAGNRQTGCRSAGCVLKASQKLNPRFLTLQNVLLQPHHASGTFETRKAMGKLLRDNLMAHFEGRPLPTPVL